MANHRCLPWFCLKDRRRFLVYLVQSTRAIHFPKRTWGQPTRGDRRAHGELPEFLPDFLKAIAGLPVLELFLGTLFLLFSGRVPIPFKSSDQKRRPVLFFPMATGHLSLVPVVSRVFFGWFG